MVVVDGRIFVEPEPMMLSSIKSDRLDPRRIGSRKLGSVEGLQGAEKSDGRKAILRPSFGAAGIVGVDGI